MTGFDEELRKYTADPFTIGFSEYYMKPNGEVVAVPKGRDVPRDWELVAD